METIAGVAVVTAEFLFGSRNCVLNSGAGMSDLSLFLEILHMCKYTHVQSYVSSSMHCILTIYSYL